MKPLKKGKFKKLNLGTIFQVPLGDGRFVYGLIARADKSSRGGNSYFGYFFKKISTKVQMPDEEVFKDIIWSTKFGDLGLYEGDWPVVGELSGFRKEDWPLPLFRKVEPIRKRKYLVRYEENSLGLWVEEFPFVGKDSDYPEDGLAGSGLVEKVLLEKCGSSS